MHSIPKAGDFIYLGSELYLSHGEDDIIGGLAEIMRVEQTGEILASSSSSGLLRATLGTF